MRVVCFANNWVGVRVVRHLRRVGEDVVAVVMHPEGRRTYGERLDHEATLAGADVVDGSCLDDPGVQQMLQDLKPTIGISAYFGYLLRPSLLDLFPRGCVNVHPALLPYNRGSFPNVWSIVDGTPAGVTLHYIDEGVDSGDIVSQCEVPVTSDDTGASLYRRLELAASDLFEGSWPALRAGTSPRAPQDQGAGTLHRIADISAIDEIVLDRCYTAKHLLDVIRARTFAPHRGAYFDDGDARVYVSVELRKEPRP